MKKIKLFFVRNYQRFIRFLISFSAIGCILVSSFCVGALSSADFNLGAPVSVSLVRSDGSVFTADTDNLNGVTFSASTVKFNQTFSNPKSIDLFIPFNFSIPEGSEWESSFLILPRVMPYVSGVYPAHSVTAYLVSGDTRILICSDGSLTKYYARCFIPRNTLSENLKLYIHYDFSNSFDCSGIRTLYAGQYNSIKYGTSSDFFFSGVNDFFTKSVSNLSAFLEKIVSSPALSALCLAMPICCFAVILYGRLRHT